VKIVKGGPHPSSPMTTGEKRKKWVGYRDLSRMKKMFWETNKGEAIRCRKNLPNRGPKPEEKKGFGKKKKKATKNNFSKVGLLLVKLELSGRQNQSRSG